MKLKINQRKRLIVYVYSLKRVTTLKHYGDLQYVSKSMHYAILNVNQADVSRIKNTLRRLHFVKTVLDSPMADLSKELIKKTIQESVDEG